MAGVEKVCVVCGGKFRVPPVRAESAKTCSMACKGKLWTKQNEEARPRLACKVCGGMFTCPPSHEGRRQTCSPQCADKARVISSNRPGPTNFHWKGGQSGHADGYLYLLVSGHPFAKTGSYVFEHRLVMEQWMREAAPNHKFLVDVDGLKYLSPDIEVHHIDENKRNNRRKNLLACTSSAHRVIHHGKPPMAGEVWPNVAGQLVYAPTRIDCTCEVCGKVFAKKRSDVARGSGRFCSRACYFRRPSETYNVIHE